MRTKKQQHKMDREPSQAKAKQKRKKILLLSSLNIIRLALNHYLIFIMIKNVSSSSHCNQISLFPTPHSLPFVCLPSSIPMSSSSSLTTSVQPHSPTSSSSSSARFGSVLCSSENLSSSLCANLLDRLLVIVVVGASGDLAVKKTYPALFSLYVHRLLPPKFLIAGYARSPMKIDEFHKKITSKFPKNSQPKDIESFLLSTFYHCGQYDSVDDFKKLHQEILIRENESSCKLPGSNRVFYFAIPPSIFVPTATSIRHGCLTTNGTGWNRVIVEKPFGFDSETSAKLGTDLSALYAEEEIYRIDHYLGKEMVQNLMVLRFSNKVFEPLWNSNHIQAVLITFKEDFGTQGRGGYFDAFGIIRDVMQNHLLQILSLIGMEAPVTLGAEDVRDEKVKLLRAIRPIQLSDIVIGQYAADPKGKEGAYTDDPTVPKGSITPTFACAVLHIDNERWGGCPFILKCGKALNERKADIRVQFKTPKNQLFDDVSSNELVLRVQPDEAVYLKLSTKKPGLEGGITHTELDLSYKNRFQEEAKNLPDAYERLIYDVIRGDHNLFVRSDELEAAWKIFTPILHLLDKEKIAPLKYNYGGRGPPEADQLIQKYGFKRTEKYVWNQPTGSGNVSSPK